MRSNLTASVLALMLGIPLYACRAERPSDDKPVPTVGPLSSTPLAKPGTAASKKLFSEVTPTNSGIAFTNFLKKKNVRRYLEQGSGVAVGDYDGDGRPDIYLVSLDGPNKLFRQTSPWKFEDVTLKVGDLSGGTAWGTGATFVDIDNDGDLDLYVCNLNSANLLYINQGNGKFAESAKSFGLAHVGASVVASFADYDLDGDLDMYLLTNRVFSVAEELPGGGKLQVVDGRPTVPPQYRDQYMVIAGHMTQAGQRDILFRNDGNNKFSDVSKQAGIHGHDMGLAVTWFDYDGDAHPDIYISNDLKTPDRLYRNNGDGTFRNVIAGATVQTSWSSMGADSADINNDGKFDLLTSDMAATTHFKAKATMGNMTDASWFLTQGRPRQFMRNSLYLGTGTPRWLEAAYAAGIANTDWTWSVRFGDLDNDGLVDLHVTNGMARQVNDSDHNIKIDKLNAAGKTAEATQLGLEFPRQDEANAAFRNTGNISFEKVSRKWGLDRVGVSHGAVMADLDRDGDLDIIVNNLNAPVSVYRNNGTSGRRVLVKLRGKRSNRFGVGATVRVRSKTRRQVRQLFPTRGYMSSDEPVLHFGLGDHEQIDEITVDWPSGHHQRFTKLAVDTQYTITEPDTAPPPRQASTHPPSRFTESARALGVRFNHKERRFDDYAREPLLPYKMSKQGPGLAWADIDGDGRDDLFIGGAAGQAGGMFVQASPGKFKRIEGPWQAHSESEDVAIVFFDADGDGDQDLYVAHGSTEYKQGDALYRDSLFFNDGKGTFKERKNALPDLRDSTGAVAVADFDGDGDLDIFVGARSIAGAYPKTPTSRLLSNNGGRFTDVTAAVAPQLAQAGLVTGATWSDIDGDGWLDLVVATDWGPIRVFSNRKGKLVETTTAAGLGKHLGLWRGIAAADIDGDGDMDFVATNLGQNTKYHASPEHPIKLYYADFDKNGTLDLVEAKYEGDTLYPGRGRSCSSGAMPFIKDKFQTYNSFAKARLDGIYDLANAPVRTASYLSSALLINNGSGRFEVRELPRLAQISTAQGVALTDLNGDGHLDIYIAQNFFGAQPETGLLSGGLGLVLDGDGKGHFTAVWPDVSGVVMPEAATGVAIGDADGDGRPDIAVAGNHAPVRLFRNKQHKNQSLVLRLAGPTGNPTGIGAQVTLVRADGVRTTQQVSAGSGYLSSSTAALFFGLGQSQAREIIVRWPGGRTSRMTRAIKLRASPLVIKYK